MSTARVTGAVAEAEDPVLARRADGIDVSAEPEQLRSLLRRERVVDGDPDGDDVAEEPNSPDDDEAPEVVGIPGATREEAMVSLPVDPLGHRSDDQSLGDGVVALGQDPADDQHDEVAVARLGQGVTKDFHQGQESARNGLVHGACSRLVFANRSVAQSPWIVYALSRKGET